MKKALNLTAGLLFASAVFAGCPEDPPPAPPKVEPKVEPKVIIPAYAPTGENAEAMKAAAMTIGKDNAEAKAIELEAKIDGMIKALETAKAAAPTK